MKKIYFTVGPSQILPTIPGHLKQAVKDDVLSMSHRGKEFADLYKRVDTGLKKLLNIPSDYYIFFISSGTEAMERSIQNLVEKKSFHFVIGKFGDRFFEIAQELGRQPEMIEQDGAQAFDLKTVQIPKDTELIAFTHNDTSTGTQIPMKFIYDVHTKNPNAMIAIDSVSSMPYVDIDYKQVDVVFFSVQKGFGLPAGLGLMIVSPRAVAKASELAQKGFSIGSYHSFPTLAASADKYQTPETPNVLDMYLLEKGVQEFLKIGIKKIRRDTDRKAALLYKFFDKHPQFRPLVTDTVLRSQTTPVIEVIGGSKDLLTSLAKKGFIVGFGYGAYKDQHIRIANFPALSLNQVKLLIRAIKEENRHA